MASLEAALDGHSGDLQRKLKQRQTKPRLVADPSVTVRQLMDVLRSFVNFRETKDFHSLIAPSKYLKLNWNCSPEPDFLLKLSGLAFDLANLAPNSKLSGSKLRSALKGLIESGEITNQTNRSDEKFVDNADLLIRIGMSMFRNLKKDLTVRDPFLRRLANKDATRIKLVLDRLLLPKDYSEEFDEDEQMDSAIVAWDLQSKPSTEDQGSPEELAADKAKDLEEALDFDMSWTQQIGDPTKIAPGSSTDALSPKRKHFPRASSISFRFSPSNLDSPPPASTPRAPQKKKQGKPQSDADLLAEAEGYVPERSNPKPRKLFKRPSMKRPSASGEVLKKPAAAAKDDPEEDQAYMYTVLSTCSSCANVLFGFVDFTKLSHLEFLPHVLVAQMCFCFFVELSHVEFLPHVLVVQVCWL